MSKKFANESFTLEELIEAMNLYRKNKLTMTQVLKKVKEKPKEIKVEPKSKVKSKVKSEFITEKYDLNIHPKRKYIIRFSDVLLITHSFGVGENGWWYRNGVFGNIDPKEWGYNYTDVRQVIAYCPIYSDSEIIEGIPLLPPLNYERQTIEYIKNKLKDKTFTFDEFYKALNYNPFYKESIFDDYAVEEIIPIAFEISEINDTECKGEYIYET
jgi:hypothetical protein